MGRGKKRLATLGDPLHCGHISGEYFVGRGVDIFADHRRRDQHDLCAALFLKPLHKSLDGRLVNIQWNPACAAVHAVPDIIDADIHRDPLRVMGENISSQPLQHVRRFMPADAAVDDFDAALRIFGGDQIGKKRNIAGIALRNAVTQTYQGLALFDAKTHIGENLSVFVFHFVFDETRSAAVMVSSLGENCQVPASLLSSIGATVMSRLIKIAVFAALVLLPAAAVSAQDMMQSPPPPLPAGTRAPAFTTTTTGGRPLTLKSLRGKVVLLDYWATWCGPCQMATPVLQSLHKQFGKKGLRIVGMSVDDSHSVANVKPFMKHFGMTYTVTTSPLANGRAEAAYHVNGIPSQFLIDKKGIVRWSQSGFSQNEGQEIALMIKRLLAEK